MLVAYVDATYRPTDSPLRTGNQKIPYTKQGSSQTEMMATQDVLEIYKKHFQTT